MATADGEREFAPITGVSAEPHKGAVLSRDQLETFFGERMKATPVCGAAISVVYDGARIFEGGYGAVVADGARVDPHKNAFRAGSISKLLTWTAVMQLKEAGKLDLDADVNTYLRSMHIADPHGYGPITLRHLLTHSAGFEENQCGYMVTPEPSGIRLAETLVRHPPARVRPPTQDFSRGEGASYSGWSAVLAGHLVEQVSGLPFDEYVEANIFARLGMTRSTFAEPVPAEWRNDVARGHLPAGMKAQPMGPRRAGQATAYQPQAFEYYHSIAPAGSLTCTVTDMARFMIAHLGGGASPEGIAPILRPETLDEMHARTLSPHRHVNGAALGFYERYINGRRVLLHEGATMYFLSALALIPEEKVGIFIAFNSPTADPADTLVQFMDTWFPATTPDVAPCDGFEQRVPQWLGTYFPNPHSYTKIDKFLLLRLPAFYEVAVTRKERSLTITNQAHQTSDWTEVRPGIFRQTQGQHMLVFTGEMRGRAKHVLGPWAFAPATRLNPWETPAFHVWLLRATRSAFSIAVAWAIWTAGNGAAVPALATLLRDSAAVLALVHIVAFEVLWMEFADPYALLYGFSRRLRHGLEAVRFACGFTLLVGACFVAALLFQALLPAEVFLYSLFMLAAGGHLWSLNEWNLLGEKFP